MFDFMNKLKGLDIVDYKTFLSFISKQNGPKVSPYEEFDWVENVL